MPTPPAVHEMDHHILKLFVGFVALTLAIATAALSSVPLDSISASYHEGGLARDILVGSLCAVAAIMLAHNGSNLTEMRLSKVSGIAALGVALFPCDCGGHPEVVPYVHYASAAVMFAVLAAFCWNFYKRAKTKTTTEAKFRAAVYAGSGITIVLVLLILGGDFLLGGVMSDRIARLVFYGEAAGLVAFGVSWLVASRTLPLITSAQHNERIHLFSQ